MTRSSAAPLHAPSVPRPCSFLLPEGVDGSSEASRDVPLSGCRWSPRPFAHFRAAPALSERLASDLLSWMERAEGWRRHANDVYRSATIHLSPANAPRAVRLFEDGHLAQVKAVAEAAFTCRFRQEVFVSANRHAPGDAVGMHNDHVEPASRDRFFFTHRLVMYLNPDWQPEHGGVLQLHGRHGAVEVRIDPLHNTCVGLAMGRHSHHSVTAIAQGSRYSLVFGLVTADGEYAPQKRHA
jgi:hypothetical protein